jgi:hypothetical protein
VCFSVERGKGEQFGTTVCDFMVEEMHQLFGVMLTGGLVACVNTGFL